jgi:hypothetical protein
MARERKDVSLGKCCKYFNIKNIKLQDKDLKLKHP